MVRDRPWMGSGLGTWPIVFPRYAAFDSGLVMPAAHNDWLQWAAEGGLPFALLLGIFAALLWKPAVQSIFGIGTIAFLLHALVDFPMQLRPALAAWFFAIAGTAAAWRTDRTAGTDGLLRGVRSSADRGPGGNPEGIQEARAPAPSGSMPG
jgi:O-antigen ligase